MKEVRINKGELREIVRKNRKEHLGIFLEAQKRYRERAIELLDQELALARSNQPFHMTRITQLVAPENHTDDYDRVIHMLDMEVSRYITLSQREFAQLVEDEWEWGHSWSNSNSPYVQSLKFNKYKA